MTFSHNQPVPSGAPKISCEQAQKYWGVGPVPVHEWNDAITKYQLASEKVSVGENLPDPLAFVGHLAERYIILHPMIKPDFSNIKHYGFDSSLGRHLIAKEFINDQTMIGRLFNSGFFGASLAARAYACDYDGRDLDSVILNVLEACKMKPASLAPIIGELGDLYCKIPNERKHALYQAAKPLIENIHGLSGFAKEAMTILFLGYFFDGTKKAPFHNVKLESIGAEVLSSAIENNLSAKRTALDSLQVSGDADILRTVIGIKYNTNPNNN